MEDIFKSFCAFGAGGKGSEALMDNAKCAKLFRDLKLLDKKLTATDIDIFFNRPEVKAKTDRKINYSQFVKLVELAAQKKYPGDADSYKKLEAKMISGEGPSTQGATKACKTGAVDRLTDTTKYTGSHKERFDESGKGRGIEGRKDFDDKASSGYVGGYKGKDTYDKTH